MKKQRNTPTVNISRRVGSAPPNVGWAVAGFVFAFIVGQLAIETWAGWQLRFNPSLGPSWHGLYPPFVWVRWWWMVAQPLSGALHQPYLIYPPNVVWTLGIMGWVAFGAFLFAIVFAVFVQIALDRKSTPHNKDDLFDSGATWAQEREARADNLLGGKCGPIIGGMEMKDGKVRPLRYGGSLGISYTDPPEGGKSAFLKTNALISLRHEDAASWSADQRRLHPFGEEPICVRTDPKGELTRDCSGAEAKDLGKRIIIVAPLGLEGEMAREIAPDKLGRQNPLWSMALGTDSGVQDALVAADAVIKTASKMDGTAHASHWDRATLGWGAGVFEKLGFYAVNTGQPELFSLPGFAEFLASFSSLDAMLEWMLTQPDDPTGAMGWTEWDPTTGARTPTRIKPSIARFARLMVARDPKERSAIFSTLTAFVVKYFSDRLARYIRSNSFDWRAIANDPKRATSVNLLFDAMESEFLQPYLRQLIRSMFRDLMRGGTVSIDGRSARPNLRPVELQLDEAAILEYCEEFDTKSGFLRGNGIRAWLIWQSQAQRRKYYGKEDTMNETFGAFLYGASRTVKAAEEIATELGSRDVEITSGNLAGQRFGITPLLNLHEQVQIRTLPLLSAKKITQLPRDHYLGIINGHNYYLQKWGYYQNPTLNARSKRPYVRESEDCYEGREPFFITALRGTMPESKWDAWMDYVKSNALDNGSPGESKVYASADMSGGAGEPPAEGTGDDLGAAETAAGADVVAAYESAIAERRAKSAPKVSA